MIDSLIDEISLVKLLSGLLNSLATGKSYDDPSALFRHQNRQYNQNKSKQPT